MKNNTYLPTAKEQKERERDPKKEVNRGSITVNGNDHTIKPATDFKQVTGSYLERRMPNKDAPAICNNRMYKSLN